MPRALILLGLPLCWCMQEMEEMKETYGDDEDFANMFAGGRGLWAACWST